MRIIRNYQIAYNKTDPYKIYLDIFGFINQQQKRENTIFKLIKEFVEY